MSNERVIAVFDNSSLTKTKVLLDLYEWAGEDDGSDSEDEYDYDERDRRDRHYAKGHPRNKKHQEPTRRSTNEQSKKGPRDSHEVNTAIKENNVVQNYHGRYININFAPWPILDLTCYCNENMVAPEALDRLYGEKVKLNVK